MENNKTISVFEYESISIDDKCFKEEHYKSLVKFNDLHGSKYFTVGYNKITFKSYVGVIQVGNKVIEVLPKADINSLNNKDTIVKWQKALLYMLEKAGYIRLNKTEKASQDSSKNNLLDVYLYTFLREVEKLSHAGLVKKYRRTVNNTKTLKGRLLINKQIQHNTIHKERFYTEHTVYDNNNLLNSILKRALKVITDITNNHAIKIEASKLLLCFDNVDTWAGTFSSLENINFDRKSTHYEYAIEIAKLIIQNFCPDLSAGSHHVLAILFDMNKLFEKYIYNSLKKREFEFSDRRLSVIQQNSKKFWKDKTIRPDILITFQSVNNKERSVIVDTKWKIVTSDNPSDADLKQMYTYNLQFGADKSILFYPKTDQFNNGIEKYASSKVAYDFSHGCELYFADLFDRNNIISETFAWDFLNEQCTS